jgi:hypothetical protein
LITRPSRASKRDDGALGARRWRVQVGSGGPLRGAEKRLGAADLTLPAAARACRAPVKHRFGNEAE